MTTILDGKALAKKITDSIKQETALLEKRPKLAVVLVGNNPASEIYVPSFKEWRDAYGGLLVYKHTGRGLRSTAAKTELYHGDRMIGQPGYKPPYHHKIIYLKIIKKYDIIYIQKVKGNDNLCMYVQFVVNNLKKIMCLSPTMANVGEKKILIINLNRLLGVKILIQEKLTMNF